MQEQESSPSFMYTREELLSKYRRFECPQGLEAHSLIYNPIPAAEPELYNVPLNLSSAVSLKKPPRTAVAAAVGAALGAGPESDARGAARLVPPKPPNPQPLSLAETKKAIVRWSDGRPLFMVAYKDLLPLADEFLIKRGIMRGRRYQELYEAAIADLYNDLVRQKRILLPPPLTQAFRLTADTSIALWPTFRELFLHSEDLLHHLSMWEASLEDLPLEPSAVMVLPPDVCWEYLDPKNTVQGPFTSAMMSEWFRGEFFPPSLPIRVCGTTQFTPLAELYPFAQRDVYVPFITTPPLDALPPVALPSLQPVAEQVAQPAAPTVDPPPAPIYNAPAPEQTPHREGEPRPAVARAADTPLPKARPANEVARQDSRRQREEQRLQEQALLQEELKRKEAERIRVESERVAALIVRGKQLEQEEQARREAARREKELRDARALAEQLAVESSMKSAGAPTSGTSTGSNPAKWKQPTLVDRQDAGPSLEESRRIKEKNTTPGSAKVLAAGSEWSRKLAGKGVKSAAAKGKKIGDVLPPRSAWQIRPSASPTDAWFNEPALDASAPSPATDSRKEEFLTPAATAPSEPAGLTPQARVETSPATVRARAPPVATSEDARVNIQNLCAHYHVSLDPDFVTMLIGMPDLETAKSFLTDNLPNMSTGHVADFAEAFWDVVRNPFQPVAAKKGVARRK